MTKQSYTFSTEPRGSHYWTLLETGLAHCDRAMLVVRDWFAKSESAVSALDQLQAFEVERRRSSHWPGTSLIGHDALLIRLALTPASVALLGHLADGLYDWCEPNLPEDLCLLRPDGSPWLVSIAHEGDAHLELSTGEYQALVMARPEFAAMLSSGT